MFQNQSALVCVYLTSHHRNTRPITLQNHHLSLAFGIMSDPHCNILLNLSPEQKKEVCTRASEHDVGYMRYMICRDSTSQKYKTQNTTLNTQHSKRSGTILTLDVRALSLRILRYRDAGPGGR